MGTTALTIDGSNFVYGYRRPGKYSGQLTLAASSTATVAVNGQTLYSFSAAGTYSINLKLYFQEIVVITVTGTVSISGSSWRYTV